MGYAPAAFTPPIAFFLAIGIPEYFVVDASGASWLVRGNSIKPFDTHAGEPLIAVTAAASVDLQQWIGRTASGKLVTGSLKGANACTSVEVDEIGSFPYEAYFRQKDTLVFYGERSCSKHTLPPGTIGVAFADCGIGSATLAFDRHRVFSTTLFCAYD